MYTILEKHYCPISGEFYYMSIASIYDHDYAEIICNSICNENIICCLYIGGEYEQRFFRTNQHEFDNRLKII